MKIRLFSLVLYGSEINLCYKFALIQGSCVKEEHLKIRVLKHGRKAREFKHFLLDRAESVFGD